MTEEEVVKRYRQNYGLPDTIGATHVEKHRKLESELTKRLWNSTSTNRWQEFDACYTMLYQTLDWLNVPTTGLPPTEKDPWLGLLKANSDILEVGSGKGELIRRLASSGHRCVATEITIERGQKHTKELFGVQWRSTDGINLAKFDPPATYDYVISSQVIEHMHPDDILIHFTNVRLVLRPRGEYILDTPHRGSGPHDLSRVFGLDHANFMHLREYDFTGLERIARAAGFSKLRAILFGRRFGLGPIKSQLLFQYLVLVDSVLSSLRINHKLERRIRRFLRFFFVPSNIWIAVQN